MCSNYETQFTFEANYNNGRMWSEDLPVRVVDITYLVRKPHEMLPPHPWRAALVNNKDRVLAMFDDLNIAAEVAKTINRKGIRWRRFKSLFFSHTECPKCGFFGVSGPLGIRFETEELGFLCQKCRRVM